MRGKALNLITQLLSMGSVLCLLFGFVQRGEGGGWGTRPGSLLLSQGWGRALILKIP